MKTTIYSILAAAACGMAFGQTAYTTPVGYITHTVNSQGGPETLTIIGPSLIQSSVYAGLSTVTPSGGAAITLPTGVPTTLDASYVLEITSGASEGWWSTVTSSTATSITVNDNFPASLPANTQISVRKHNTLQTFLGENTPGIIPFDGATGDEVQILNPDQSVTAFAYLPAAVSDTATDDWYSLGSGMIANDQIIEPGAAVIMKSNTSTTLTFVTTGEVKITDTQVDLFPGLTLVAQTDAAGANVNEMNLQFSLIPLNSDASNTDFDEFQILNTDQSITAYAAADPALFGSATVANLSDSSDAGTTVLGEGKGAIIKRFASNPASTITIPGSVVVP